MSPPCTALTAALAATLLTGCAAGQDSVDPPAAAPPAAAPPSTAASPPAGSSAATPSPTGAAPSATPSATARVITAGYAGGEVTVGSARVETSIGEQVVLRISSDVTEQIHVHGYDVYADVPAGGSVDIPLTLTLPGSYEVELHEAGRPLLQLRTR